MIRCSRLFATKKGKKGISSGVLLVPGWLYLVFKETDEGGHTLAFECSLATTVVAGAELR